MATLVIGDSDTNKSVRSPSTTSVVADPSKNLRLAPHVDPNENLLSIETAPNLLQASNIPNESKDSNCASNPKEGAPSSSSRTDVNTASSDSRAVSGRAKQAPQSDDEQKALSFPARSTAARPSDRHRTYLLQTIDNTVDIQAPVEQSRARSARRASYAHHRVLSSNSVVNALLSRSRAELLSQSVPEDQVIDDSLLMFPPPQVEVLSSDVDPKSSKSSPKELEASSTPIRTKSMDSSCDEHDVEVSVSLSALRILAKYLNVPPENIDTPNLSSLLSAAAQFDKSTARVKRAPVTDQQDVEVKAILPSVGPIFSIYFEGGRKSVVMNPKNTLISLLEPFALHRGINISDFITVNRLGMTLSFECKLGDIKEAEAFLLRLPDSVASSEQALNLQRNQHSILFCRSCFRQIANDSSILVTANREGIVCRYHHTCCVCTKCSSQISTPTFSHVFVGSDTWCISCCSADFGSKCSSCNTPFSDRQRMCVIGNRSFHLESSCLSCSSCRKSLLAESITGISYVPVSARFSGTHLLCKECWRTDKSVLSIKRLHNRTYSGPINNAHSRNSDDELATPTSSSLPSSPLPSPSNQESPVLSERDEKSKRISNLRVRRLKGPRPKSAQYSDTPTWMGNDPAPIPKSERLATALGAIKNVLDGSESWHIRFSDLHFEQRLGKGASATVYRATYKGTETVAVKLLRMEEEEPDLELFVKELVIMSRLSAPNIVSFYGATLEPKLCFVMEFCPGGTLTEYLKKANVSIGWDQVVQWAWEMACGVRVLHEMDPPIVHRDLKSMNLLLSADLTIKVCDFGLSRFTKPPLHRILQRKNTLAVLRGTYLYTAPEIYHKRDYTAKSDVYSLGIVLWELCQREITGQYQQPFSEYSHLQFDFQIIYASAVQNTRPTIHPDTPLPLEQLIIGCFQADPDLRPHCRDIENSLLKLNKDKKSVFNLFGLIKS